MLPSELSPISTGSTEPSAPRAPVLGKDDFLLLLVTQLQNQDPLNPADHTEFTAQLAQFSSLEQLNNVNDNLEELQNYQASTNNSQAVSLLGKEITTNGNFLQLVEGESIDCDFSLAGDAAKVVVSIYDSTGKFVREIIEKNRPAGRQTLNWDGTNTDGHPVKDGNYTFEVQAVDGNEQKVKVTTFFAGLVDKVTFEKNIPFLISGDQKIALSDVIQVAAPGHAVESSGLEE